MKKVIFFLILFPLFGYSVFTDPYTRLTFEVPDGYVFDREESPIKKEGDSWWYCFINEEGNQFLVEIEVYDHILTLFEHFHTTMTDGKNHEDLEDRNFLLDNFQFRQVQINGREFTKCQLRALAVEEEILEPVYICDYLFVKDHYGFTFGFLRKEDAEWHQEAIDAFMKNILESIQFLE